MTDEGRQPVVLGPGDARRIELGGFSVSVYADHDTTGGAYSLIETAESEIGAGPPLHVHADCAESFVVLAGRYRMHIDGRDFDCPAGTFTYVPRGLPHTFQSAELSSRKLNLYTPAGMVGYFDELAAGIAAGMDPDELDDIAGRYSMEVVGPIPPGYL